MHKIGSSGDKCVRDLYRVIYGREILICFGKKGVSMQVEYSKKAFLKIWRF